MKDLRRARVGHDASQHIEDDGPAPASKKIETFRNPWALTLLDRRRIHVSEFPDVSVEVLKSVAVHEALILRLLVGRSTGSYCFANQLVDFVPALRRQAHQDFGVLGCVTNLLRREALELVLHQQHNINDRADDDAGRGCVGELRIKGEPKLAEEIHHLLRSFTGKLTNTFLATFFLL